VFFFQAEDGIRDLIVTGVQTCALPICAGDRVAVLGAGYMGRLHLALCRAMGAAGVGVVDVSTDRLAEAEAAGAAWNAQPDATDEIGRASCRERVEISV